MKAQTTLYILLAYKQKIADRNHFMNVAHFLFTHAKPSVTSRYIAVVRLVCMYVKYLAEADVLLWTMAKLLIIHSLRVSQ